MANMPASSQLRRAGSRQSATAQLRQNAASDLYRMTPRWDEIARQAQLGIDHPDAGNFYDLEELVHRFCRDAMTVVRGARPVNAPLFVSADRTSAGW